MQCLQCLFMLRKLVTITDGNSVFTKSQDSTATEFSNALVPGKKKSSEAGWSDCSFNKFFIRKFWLLY